MKSTDVDAERVETRDLLCKNCGESREDHTRISSTVPTVSRAAAWICPTSTFEKVGPPDSEAPNG